MAAPAPVKDRAEVQEVPPDAGASYLGAYTLRNVWAVWLLKHDPSLLARSPGELHKSDIGKPPECEAALERWSAKAGRWYRFKAVCGRAMVYRPGGWSCYQHRETVRRRMFLHVDPVELYEDDGETPLRDVIALVGKDAGDLEYRDGKWRAKAVKHG